VNTFAYIERLAEFQFQRVKYFSIRIEGNEVNEFYDFLNRMEDIKEIEDDLNNLLVWIDEIGERYGAIKDRFFRNESIYADVSALPPPRKQMEFSEIFVKNLRLYCLVANENVVFLFNGGIKTTDKAQNCPNVSQYIKQANLIAKKIDELYNEGEIRWSANSEDILFDENLEFEL
jgi:hypothetical protein